MSMRPIHRHAGGIQGPRPRCSLAIVCAAILAAPLAGRAAAQDTKANAGQPGTQPAAQPEATPDDGATTILTWSGSRIEATGLEPSTAALDFRSAGTRRTMGWHEIRDITGDGAVIASPHLGLGRTVWRAKARLDRGDAFGAEPLFEEAFETTRGVIGPTPAAVADGLLRCRLRRDARASAIDAWVELAANLAAAPARVPDWGLRDPAVEPRTRLVPALPPIWFDSPAARAFARSIPDPVIGEETDARVADPAALRVLYHAAACFAVGDPIDAGRTTEAAEAAARNPGGSFVADVVLAQIGGPNTRADARTALAREQSMGNERWRAVWATIAIGRSLLRESDEETKRRGILELLSVHALDPQAAPYLTAIALADAALAADELGDTAAASAIRADLRRDFPGHPVRELPGLSDADDRPRGARTWHADATDHTGVRP